MLNVTEVTEEVNVERQLVLCFDVSKDKLDGFAEHRGPELGTIHQVTGALPNRTRAIENKLTEFAAYADAVGLEGLHVVCEPTGGYERKLLRTARRLGYTTAYVNSEHVAKASVIESGDTGKTDSMDARVISMIAKLNKTQTDRALTGEYLLLRELGQIYDDEDRLYVQTRCRVHAVLKELFCDYQKSREFIFSNTGQALFDQYGWNPHRIARGSFAQFRRKMKKKVKQVREKTLRELWDQATNSARQQVPLAYRQLLEQRLKQLWADYRRHLARKEELEEQMATLYRELHSRGEVPDRIGVVRWFTMSRVIAETGPLEDFDHWRQLLHYAGLNIRERKSGTYVGQEKITKKGRSLLRKVVWRAILPLLKRDRLFGTYYRRKCEAGMKPLKVQVAVMRKFLKLLYGLHSSGDPFDPKRVFACESQYAASS